MCRAEDADPWTLYESDERVARKEHRCGECWRTIRVGESHHWAHGLVTGQWTTHRTCAHCAAAAVWLERTCHGWIYGEVCEELVEHWREDEVYRSAWLARAIAGMRRKWLDGRIPVPGEPPVDGRTGMPITAPAEVSR